MNKISKNLDYRNQNSNRMILILIIALCTPFILAKIFSNNSEDYFYYQNLADDNLVMVYADNKPLHDKNTKPTKSPVKLSIKKQINATNDLKNNQWTQIILKNGDTLSGVFNRLNLGNGLLQEILRQTNQKRILAKLHTGDVIQFYISNNKLEKFKLPYGKLQELEIFRMGRVFKSKISYRAMTTKQIVINTKINRNIYWTARQHSIPGSIIQQVIKSLAASVNISRGARSSDKLAIVYNANYVDDKLVNYGKLLYASYETFGKKYQTIYFEDRPGHGDYYNELGRNSKKAFDRYPVNFSHISSSFSNSRYHPVLHYSRPHRGLDLAARIGTPIRATGDGRIEFIGRQGGYGNMIKIKHDSVFKTVYGHMLRFERGLSRGSWIKRGQVIGYVGQTGLASGPHCHYEVHMNNQARNPATVAIPLASPLFGKVLARFRSTLGVYVAKVNSTNNNMQLAKVSNTPKNK